MARSLFVLVCSGVLFTAGLAPARPARAAGEFIDVTDQVGVSVNANADQGAGCGFADIDADGDLDLVVVDGLGDPNKAFRQTAPRVFAEVGGTIGLGDTGWGKAITFADYDNDGDPDMLLTRLGATMRLYRNSGGIFTDVSASSGFAAVGSHSHTGAAWADYDNDGWLDVYITRYANVPNLLMRNRGDGTFENVALSAGVADATGFGFQPGWFDYDNDGDQDLYISNDVFGSANALFRNEGNGTFTDVSVSSGAGIDMSAMGLAVGDFDNNGLLDLYVANIATGNVLLCNNGDGTFTERAVELGVEAGVVCWGVEFLDYDHDGWLDLYVNVSSDNYIAGDGDSSDLRGRFLGAAQGGGSYPNLLYRNLGGNGFADVSAGSGAANGGRSFGSAVADYDSDGDLDIYLTNWYEVVTDSSSALLENTHVPRGQSRADWLRIRLIGTVSNRDGVGARVWLESPAGWQMREKQIGTSYLGSSDPLLHFGTAGATVIPRLFVRWPSGLEEVYYSTQSAQILTLVEGDGIPASTPYDSTVPIARASQLSITPNPTTSGARISLSLAVETAQLTVADVNGREIWGARITGPVGSTRVVSWDGRDREGRLVSGGRYFVAVENGAQRDRGNIIIVR